MHGQAPDPLPAVATAPSTDFVDALQHLGWIDVTALSVLGVFFVLGLFKGIVWQASRVLILVAAYTLAVQFGQYLSELLLSWTHAGPNPPTEEQQSTAFYIACVLLFVGVLVVLSLLALLLQRLVNKAGLGFYDRLFGGLAGVASGACVVLFLLTGVYMFFPNTKVAEAATASHSLRLSRDAVGLLGGIVPDRVRAVFPGHGPGGSEAQAAPNGAREASGAAGSAAAQPTEATGSRR